MTDTAQDPYAVATRYAAGDVTREEMITALVQWPYADGFRPVDYWDELGVEDTQSWENTTARAYRDGLITAQDYDDILVARAAR